MTSIAFDTHRAVKALKEAGFAQAEPVVATVGAAMGETLATKADLQALELQTAGRFESLYKHLWGDGRRYRRRYGRVGEADSVTLKSREQVQ